MWSLGRKVIIEPRNERALTMGDHEFDFQWHIDQKRRYFGYDKYEKNKIVGR